MSAVLTATSSSFDTDRFLSGMPIVVGSIVLALLVTFLIGLKVGRHSVIDVAWGFMFAIVAIVSFCWSAGHGNRGLRTTVLVLTVAWGARLGGYIGWRQRGHGEDARYDKMLSKAKGSRNVYAIRKVYLLQGVVLFFISLPVQVACYERDGVNTLTIVGIALWAVGVFFEAVGDAQLYVFKKDPANKGKIMDRGLWRYTRHPNYFGDTTLWWGLFLVAASHWPGVLTALSPIVMNLFLTKGSGKSLLEKHMNDRPGFKEYVERTSGFFPRPPRKA